MTDQEQVDAWRAERMTEEEIARRLGITIQEVGLRFGQRSATWEK